MNYTKSELTVKKYTVQDAIASAHRRLRGVPLCLDKLRHRDRSEMITLAELNQLADDLVDDSHYWNWSGE